MYEQWVQGRCCCHVSILNFTKSKFCTLGKQAASQTELLCRHAPPPVTFSKIACSWCSLASGWNQFYVHGSSQESHTSHRIGTACIGYCHEASYRNGQPCGHSHEVHSQGARLQPPGCIACESFHRGLFDDIFCDRKGILKARLEFETRGLRPMGLFAKSSRFRSRGRWPPPWVLHALQPQKVYSGGCCIF